LKFLQQFNLISAVPKESVPKAMEALNERSLQVTIENSGEPVVQYRFCEIDTAPSKAYIIMEGSSKPYIANITGFDLPLYTLFSTSESMWRDRKIFTTGVGQMTMVGLAYPQNPDNSFSISRSNDAFRIKQGDKVSDVPKGTAENYFMEVAGLTADHIGSQRLNISYNDLKSAVPYAEIVVKDTENNLETLKIYRIPEKTSPSKFNPDELVALTGNDTLPVLIKYIDFDPLLKLKGDFVEK
jgi:hypothetical protein